MTAGAESRFCLRPHEIRIIERVIKGEPNKIIAWNLALSEKTVKAYVHKILVQLREAGYPVTNRTALAAWGLKHLPKAAGAHAELDRQFLPEE